jgi:pimeloyl-ACP methyl ester carboxylesterase
MALTIDFTDTGAGPPVLLVPSSVSGKRQWRSMAEALRDRYRVIAIDLFGYGGTTAWPAQRPQTLDDQAGLLLELVDRLGLSEPLSLVGHSFGASVAWKAAQRLGARAACLALIEPNPFYLLAQAGRQDAWREISALHEHVQRYGSAGDWMRVAQRFADYWQGDGSWEALPADRREALAAAVPPNFHEWHAVMSEATPIDRWGAIEARTLVLSDPATRRPIREIVELLQAHCPGWTFRQCEGGHMMPLTASAKVNAIVAGFLDDTHRGGPRS